MNKAFRRRIAHLEITPDQFMAMRILSEYGNDVLTQSQLTELMFSDPNTVGALIDRMEASKLLSRQSHKDDRRAYVLRLLAAGQKKFEKARKIAGDLEKEILSCVPASGREKFLASLDVVATYCMDAAEKVAKKR